MATTRISSSSCIPGVWLVVDEVNVLHYDLAAIERVAGGVLWVQIPDEENEKNDPAWLVYHQLESRAKQDVVGN